jgi:gamma-glutamyltranspeptidase/glutathione hydrolase
VTAFRPDVDDASLIRDQGTTSVVRNQRAVCSSDNAAVTNAMLRVLRDGGNAVDAAITGCLMQGTVEPFMTNHAGLVTALVYEAKTGTVYALDSQGTMPHDLPPFKPIVGINNAFASPGHEPSACIPGFMPGLKALYERFGSKPWASLVEESIYWAEEGHYISTFEHTATMYGWELYTYFPEGRALFAPDGFARPVGSRFRNPELAQTLRRLAQEGPDDFITGRWAQRFVERANAMGWKIEAHHMTDVPPRWSDPVRYPHGGYDIVQLPLPQRTGVFCALVLGMLDFIDGAYDAADSAEAVYAMAHALRIAAQQCGFVNDPLIFETPLDVWLDRSFHAHLGNIVNRSRPRVDLSGHVEKTWGSQKLAAAGVSMKEKQPVGSCELAVVDADGNWVQMMNTLQSGGIPGQVVDGVPMVGSHASFGNMSAWIDTWLAPGAKMRCVIGNTIAMKDGRPVFSLGTPGNPHWTVAQMLANIIDRKLEYVQAVEAPRMFGLGDDFSLTIESRLPASTRTKLTAMGVRLQSENAYDFHMGSFQMAWREPDGSLGACADLRRVGVAGGFV